MRKLILKCFMEFMEKQDHLSQLAENKMFQGLSYSEIHTIAQINRIERANVTKISNSMKMTRGAISKIVKRLIDQTFIESFQSDENKKEIYYRLTDKGLLVNNEHTKAHKFIEDINLKFLDDFTDEELYQFERFFKKYNCYLNNEIEQIRRG